MTIDPTTTLLLAVDVQNDFCPGYTSLSGILMPDGALAVSFGDKVITPLNTLAAAFSAAGGWVVATQDWHPEGHISFASSHPGKAPGDIVKLDNDLEQVLWPKHCVQGWRGANFHDKFDRRPINLIIRKGFRKGLDSYSAFYENDRQTPTGLEGYLLRLGIQTVIIGGLATDYCVLYSAMDCIRLGYTVYVPEDAVRGVNIPSGSVEQAVEKMQAAGIIFTDSYQLIKGII